MYNQKMPPESHTNIVTRFLLSLSLKSCCDSTNKSPKKIKMKRFLTALIMLVCINTFAQKNYALKDLFEQQTITWYGIDYSKTSFVANYNRKDMHEIFIGWNVLVKDEPERYNLRRAMHRPSVTFDMASVDSINAATDPIISYADSTLTKDEIALMISRYKSTQKEGLGLVLLAESYNKGKNEGSHYAVIFDIASKKVLLSQRFISPPGGTGVRNFWAFSIYNTLNLLADHYTKWKRKYAM
jgi:hypothetical protein